MLAIRLDPYVRSHCVNLLVVVSLILSTFLGAAPVVNAKPAAIAAHRTPAVNARELPAGTTPFPIAPREIAPSNTSHSAPASSFDSAQGKTLTPNASRNDVYLPIRYKLWAADVLASTTPVGTDAAAADFAAPVEHARLAAPLASGVTTNTLAIQITAGTPATDVPYQGYVFFQTTQSVNYRGGRIILSQYMDGGGAISVDDQIIMTVTHQDGSRGNFSVEEWEFRVPLTFPVPQLI